MSPNVSPEDLANAEVELEQAKRYRDTSKAVDANEPTASLANLRQHGLEEIAAPLEPNKENPDVVRIVYHAYDGRSVPIPEYMAKVRLAERFPREDFIPPQWHGKRVWYLEPQPVAERQYLMCYLHEKQTDEIKAEVRAAGYAPGRCQYNQGPSPALVEKHMELKHKDEWRAIQTMRERKLTAESRSEQSRQTEAILELARALTKQNTK